MPKKNNVFKYIIPEKMQYDGYAPQQPVKYIQYQPMQVRYQPEVRYLQYQQPMQVKYQQPVQYQYVEPAQYAQVQQPVQYVRQPVHQQKKIQYQNYRPEAYLHQPTQNLKYVEQKPIKQVRQKDWLDDCIDFDEKNGNLIMTINPPKKRPKTGQKNQYGRKYKVIKTEPTPNYNCGYINGGKYYY